MSNSRLIPFGAVENRLTALGCECVERTEFPQNSYWKTPWGFHFFVPQCGAFKKTPEDVLNNIIAEIENSRPKL